MIGLLIILALAIAGAFESDTAKLFALAASYILYRL